MSQTKDATLQKLQDSFSHSGGTSHPWCNLSVRWKIRLIQNRWLSNRGYSTMCNLSLCNLEPVPRKRVPEKKTPSVDAQTKENRK